jgi:hypothetical protein
MVPVILLVVLPATPKADDYVTHYEASGYTRTPRYAETVDYCRRLAEGSRWLHYTTFGTTPQGRGLPLLIADGKRQFTPDKLRRDDKVVLLVQAGIHAGEIDGKDAGLMLLRDIAVTKKYPDLLDHVTILFIPIFNVDGHERFGPYNRINQNGPEEMGWRVTAQSLNLNRDYLKADAPEMQAWIALFNAWKPDFVVDCHVTDGSDYQYTLTYIMDVFGNMVPMLTDWVNNVYLAAVKPAMAAADFEMFPYASFVEGPNPKSGLESGVAPPRFSTGYASLRNRPSLLIETHMLKDYKTRVTATYEMLKQSIILLNAERASLKAVVADADRFTASAEFRGRLYPVQFKTADHSTTIDFKGIDFEAVESDLTGGMWYRFNGKRVTFKIPYYDRQVPSLEIDLPEAYIIPPEWDTVIERLEIHGVALRRLDEPRTLDVASYRFTDVSWRSAPYEGRHPVTFSLTELVEERTYPAGSAVVDMNQPGATVAAHILEPKAPDSYVYWGFFDGIFEQKEYTESYVMEKMAREMLAADKDLRDEFEAKKKDDPAFAGDSRAILNWFFQQSPYWDDRKDVYPVGKVYSAEQARQLLGP